MKKIIMLKYMALLMLLYTTDSKPMGDILKSWFWGKTEADIEKIVRNAYDGTLTKEELTAYYQTKNADINRFVSKDDLNISDNEYDLNALSAAAYKNRNDVLDLLLQDTNIQLNAQNSNGYTPLIFAIIGDNEEGVAKLLAKGPNANIQITGLQNNTALSYALTQNKEKIAKLLIPKTDLTLENQAGETPFAIATRMGLEDIAKEIKSAAQKPKVELPQENLIQPLETLKQRLYGIKQKIQ